jgi:hypothetical protein
MVLARAARELALGMARMVLLPACANVTRLAPTISSRVL